MRKVLHYKTNFLNPSETFIHRVVSNHESFKPIVLCYKKKSFARYPDLYEVPENGAVAWINRAAFHLDMPLPYYKKVIRASKPDIIHSHFGYDGYKLLSISQAMKIPMVISFYGSDVSRLPHERGWKRRYRRLGTSHAFFIAASSFMKQQLTSLGFPEERITVIRFGFDTRRIPFKQSNPLDKPVMLIGRLVEKKGFRYALEAIQILKNRGIVTEANIFGDGPLFQELKDLSARLGISAQIHFKGFLPIDEVLDNHIRHSLLLAPSVRASDGDMEGLPNTILEAMASGTPVVTTRHAAIPEAIHHESTGFLADERRPDQLADLMEKIFNGRYQTDETRTRARALIEREYNIRQTVAQTESLYEKVIGSGF